jgi:hypothetical protein
MIILSPIQEKLLNTIASEKYRFILFGGAMGGSKTFGSLSALLIMCEVFKGSRWCVIRENMEKIRTTTIPSFLKLNPSGTLKSSPYEYTHTNGSTIIFKGENYDNDKELNWLKGLEVSGFLFEEINECQEITLDIAFGRAGRWESEPTPTPIILATCNPAQNWVKTKIYDKFRYNKLPERWYYLPAKVTDNPHLSQDYLDNLKMMPEIMYQKFVEGDWDVVENKMPFFYSFSDLKHISEEAVYNPNLVTYLSFDFNVNPATCSVFQHTADYIYMIDEFHIENASIFELTERIKAKYYETRLKITGDASGWAREKSARGLLSMYDIISQELRVPIQNIDAPRSNPTHKQNRILVNSILEKHKNIKINPICKHTIKDLQFLQADDFGNIDKSDSKLSHHADCFRYYFNSYHSSFIRL